MVLVAACTPKARPWPEVPEAPPESSSPATQGEDRDPHDWFYTGSAGPNAWGTLRPAWAACADAENQSPIDLPLAALSAPSDGAGSGVKKPGDAQPAAPKAPFAGARLDSRLGDLPIEVSSDGRVIQLTGAASQTISLDGKLATLTRGELRRPAEHALGGVTFDLEVVLWFGLGDGSQTALSLLFRQGAPNTSLAALIDGLPKLPHYKPTLVSGRLPLGELLTPATGGGKFLSYWGSESVPPCTPQVARLVFAQVGEISADQIEKLRLAIPSLMARPVQALGTRTIGVVELNQRPTAPAAQPTPLAPSAPSTSTPAQKPASSSTKN